MNSPVLAAARTLKIPAKKVRAHLRKEITQMRFPEPSPNDGKGGGGEPAARRGEGRSHWGRRLEAEKGGGEAKAKACK